MKGAIFSVLFVIALAKGAVVVKENEDSIVSVNDDPSQAPAICAATDSNGVLVANEFCNQFYKCSFGVPVAKKCPRGLLFDPSKERCEWPNTVNCGYRIIPDKDDESEEKPITEGGGNVNDDPSQAGVLCAAEGSDHSYVAHEICNKFYQCWAGNPVPLPCPVGTLWSSKKNYCDFPNNVDCGNRIILDNNKLDGDDDGISNDEVIWDDEVPVGNNHDDPSQAAKICATPKSSGVLVAHENCNQFYTCSFGVPVAQLCPAGLLFDPTKDRCEWPNTVNCGDRIIPDKNDINEEKPTTEGSGIINDDPSQAGVICAAEGSDHSFVAHENCDMFYQCWAGKPFPLPCPVNTLWSPKKNYCDFPNNVDCGNRIIPDNNKSDGGNDVISVDDVIWEDETPIGNNHDDPSQVLKICAASNSTDVLVAHENCNQFYICTFGLPVAQSCPVGLLFDPTKDRCEWPHTVNCGDRIIPDKNDVNEEKPTTEGSGNVNDDPSQAGVICAAEGSDHSYVAHENCDMFYQCWAGKPVPLPCPVGTLWSPKKKYCDFPDNVDCGGRVVPTVLQK